MNALWTGILVIVLVAATLPVSQTSPLIEPINRAARVINPDPLEAMSSDDVPVVHNNDFDMILPQGGDEHKAASMQYQNFERFYEPQEAGDNSKYEMDESQFVHSTRVRPPQPLSWEEKRVREDTEVLDWKDEFHRQRTLEVGSTKPEEPRENPYDQFDYDWYTAARQKGALKL